MEMPQEMIEADLDRQFADWGVAVTHQLVTTVFDPSTLTASETIVETSLTALISANTASAATGTGENYWDPQMTFTFRTADLPLPEAGQSRRIVFAEVIYDVIGVDVLNLSLVTTLRCRERMGSS